jgi:hypothetical protein
MRNLLRNNARLAQETRFYMKMKRNKRKKYIRLDNYELKVVPLHR